MQLRGRYSGPLNVIWDNAPAHRGEAVRECLAAAGLGIQLVNPRFHEGRLCLATARTSTPMRRSWGWVREDTTGNLRLGTKALVQERVNRFLAGLATRKDEAKRRCRTVLQSRAEGLPHLSQPDS